ncbi:NAD(P)-dependent oxidoreductase [Neorhizobium sp. BETTINA12A]|uniref:NAD(P)-dependent oxidoreductase n=1 Tax=Neorhizobium sp. BETTINA12A TaxID=2908924 RepID=UPI001FF5CFD5|nr:NAD(P)-dependent oxidoreductase [Neorhizobium sp. BETTINA12A]MCJ9749968.1 NAD(P)-dependent oxidoreductase [Neorhizobium sp. BETTINA12A]
MTKERVGIVGLGRMGSAMAERLQKQGFSVTGWTRSGLSGEKASALGIAASAGLASLFDASDIVILALLDDAAVHAVLDELAAAAPAGKLVVDTSTVSPETLRSHQDAMGKAGAALLDAPISGGPEMLLAGTAGLYIGGAEKDFQRFLPLAEMLSNRIHHVGGLGDGASAKLVNNMMLMGLWQIMKEAVELGGKAGLGRGKMIEILSGSPAASPAMRSRLPVILGETEAVGFPVSGVLKDMGVVLDLARGLGVATPAIEAARASFENAAALGYGDADLATVVRLALERKG